MFRFVWMLLINNLKSSFLLSKSLDIGHVDAVGSFNGKSVYSCPDSVGKASEGSRNTEDNCVVIVLHHAYINKQVPKC